MKSAFEVCINRLSLVTMLRTWDNMITLIIPSDCKKGDYPKASLSPSDSYSC